MAYLYFHSAQWHQNVLVYYLMVVINSCVHFQAHKQLNQTIFFFSLFVRVVYVFFPLIWSEREFGWFVIVHTVCVFWHKGGKKVWW